MIPRYLTTAQIEHLAAYASLHGDSILEECCEASFVSGNTDVLIAEIDAHEELQAWMERAQ